MPVGRVMVLPGGPSFWRILTRLGPTMAPVAAGVLGVGMMVIAFVVFGPARRRLKAVQEATERLGAGDLDARAPDYGGDEVAALARSFNKMALELASRARALEASDAARRQLLADVSHELMTPLTAMRGYVETLGMTELKLDTPTRERYMRIVTEETHRLERIIGDLLDLARLEGGGTSMRRERVDVNAIFTRVAARHERELRERGIRLVQRVEPGAEHVIGDSDRLEQALQNLAANALRHTPEGGEILLSSSLAPDGSLLTIRDTGPGIPEEHLPLIFERFYKVDAARKAAGGSGLGLSIVKAIVERHGGRISARNDNGAIFEIVLPSGFGIRDSGRRVRVRSSRTCDRFVSSPCLSDPGSRIPHPDPESRVPDPESRLVVLSRCRQLATERPGLEGLFVDIQLLAAGTTVAYNGVGLIPRRSP